MSRNQHGSEMTPGEFFSSALVMAAAIAFGIFMIIKVNGCAHNKFLELIDERPCVQKVVRD